MRSLLLATVAVATISPIATHAATLVGLTADNKLVMIDSDTRRAAAPVAIRGVEGKVLGIDQRPSNSMLYALTDAGVIYTVDAKTGVATMTAKLPQKPDLGSRAAVDFNPVADRMRVLGMNGTSLRINVQTGETATDGTLKYHPEDRNAGTTPRINTGAYTNSMGGATATMLYTIDTLLGTFNLQAPPNEGMQRVKGSLGMSVPPSTAFDILTDAQGGNRGFVLAAGTLYMINLETGALTMSGPVTGLPGDVIDIAAMR